MASGLATGHLDLLPELSTLADGLLEVAELGGGGLLVPRELRAVEIGGVRPLLPRLRPVALLHVHLRLGDGDVGPDVLVARLDLHHTHLGSRSRRGEGRRGDRQLVGRGRGAREGDSDQRNHEDARRTEDRLVGHRLPPLRFEVSLFPSYGDQGSHGRNKK